MATKYLTQPQRRLPIRDSYDVVVVGGGIAGVAAAAAAAREGLNVCLLEKEYALGGLATLGNIVIYLPICDGTGNKVSGGLAETLLKLSIKDGSHLHTPGCYGIPEPWATGATREQRSADRYLCAYNPATYAMAMERWLLSLGVHLRYDARFSDLAISRGRIKAVIIEDKAGRSAIACKAVIDASGDADVCHAAGETLDCCSVNVPCGWFYYLAEGKMQLAKFTQDFDFGATKLPNGVKHGFACNNSHDVTEMVLTSNRCIEQQLARIRAERNASATLFRPPSIPSYRMTRRLCGATQLTLADDRRWFDDTVGLIGHWRMKGPIYAIPLRALYGKTPNLITAGRCISSGRNVWDLTRVIPACAVTGEAAGAGSAQLVRRRLRSFADIDVPALQSFLRRRKVILNRHLLSNPSAAIDPNAPEDH